MKVVSTKIWEDDLEILKRIAEESDITVSELLRMLIYSFLGNESELSNELKKIKVNAERKCKELKEVRGLLGRLSSYVNQITRSLNRIAKQGTASKEEIEEVKKIAVEVLATCLLVENWINERE